MFSFLGSLVGGLLGMSSQQSANEANIEATKLYNENQIKLQQDAQAYNERMWQMQNEYNSPLQQMQRLREANLNPNLVYGSGVTGNNTGAAPQAVIPNQQVPHRESYANILTHMFDQLTAAQVQTEQVQAMRLKNDEQRITNQFLRDTYADRKRSVGYRAETDYEGLQQSTYRTNIIQNESALVDYMREKGYSEKMADLKVKMLDSDLSRLQAQIKNIGLENALKEIDLYCWNTLRLRPGDPFYIRIIADFIQNAFGKNLGNIAEGFADRFNTVINYPSNFFKAWKWRNRPNDSVHTRQSGFLY